MQTPTIGRVVHVLVEPYATGGGQDNNGADVAPAILTRVWSEQSDHWVVDYRILRDNADVPEWKTSAALFSAEAAARLSDEAASASGQGMHAFWPPRV